MSAGAALAVRTAGPTAQEPVVQQSWQILRLDPVRGESRAELDALHDHMAASVEHTLLALARWISVQTTNRR